MGRNWIIFSPCVAKIRKKFWPKSDFKPKINYEPQIKVPLVFTYKYDILG